MKKYHFLTFALSLLFIVFFACEDEEKVVLPDVATASVEEIYSTSAKVGGKVLYNGGGDISERGIYWSISENSETTGTKIQIGSGLGVFYETLDNLTPGVKYYVKAYAKNTAGIAYGNETFFTTQINYPIIITAEVTDIKVDSAVVGGDVLDNGGTAIVEKGVYWGTTENTINTGAKISMGSGDGPFSDTLSGLSRGVTYYVRAFATNGKGTSYGNELSFITTVELPLVSTIIPRNVETHSAVAGGNISSDGGSAITERGIYWGTSVESENTGTKMALGNGIGSFLDTINNLTPGTIYYVKAFATNSFGTNYGEEISFTTLGEIPSATTVKQSNLEAYSSTLNGLVNAHNLSTTVSFEYGTSTAYGQTANASENPVTGNGDSTVSANISNLLANTLYHFRVVAINELGTNYGDDLSFTTVITGLTGSVVDADANNYQTIGIGYQCWMTQNLKTTKYNDGTNITLVNNDSIWNTLTSGGYCFYDTNATYKNTYGALYNWYAVNTNKLCPTGWHVPTESDYDTLISYLGGATEVGKKLKEAGTTHWKTPNTDATDEFDFTALPGGKRDPDGLFDFMTIEGDWWLSNEYSTKFSNYFYMMYNYNNSFKAYTNKTYGLSVRCIKD
ncbi:MAG: hypothetical protein A2X00_16510 [Bacteroidetes bacterium GWE2_32_14]|nr:MAG: hypothetical protein A2X00_16510 [Bacteroidetes bacterium GWE2_32_14]